ncbi:MAG TPA: hypothetical protein VFF49_03120 [Thermodesulfobacteriota bacterium]|nr:hypothetical protein [Thermodesulfobacteriota bacterium]
MFDEYETRKKTLQKAIQIAKREWENIKSSLMYCGDIGEFCEEDFMIGVIEEDVIIREPLISPTKSVSGYAPTFYPMYLVDNLIIMDDKMPNYRYKTVEALYVFIELATKAVERLGLVGIFCIGFGSGYGYVRTGWIGEKGRAEERDIFYQMFYKGRVDYDWDFHWTSVRQRLKLIFTRFMAWQNNPKLYEREVKPRAKVKPMMV